MEHDMSLHSQTTVPHCDYQEPAIPLPIEYNRRDASARSSDKCTTDGACGVCICIISTSDGCRFPRRRRRRHRNQSRGVGEQ